MRVASYNIRKAVGSDWRRDPDRIVDVLSEINADVVVLQEADRRIGERGGVLPLKRMEDELGYILPDVSIRALSHGWHGNAILIGKRFGGYTPARIELPSLEPRGAVSVLLDNPQVEFVGVHLGLTPGVRRKQMDALGRALATRSHPVILAGDFNEWNVKRLRSPASFSVVAPGPSFHAARPVAALDVFMLSAGLRAISSHVHHSSLARRASDHLPVVLDFEMSGPP